MMRLFQKLFRRTIGRVQCYFAGDHNLDPIFQPKVKSHGRRCYMFHCRRCDWRSTGGVFLPYSKGIQLERRSKAGRALTVKVGPRRAV